MKDEVFEKFSEKVVTKEDLSVLADQIDEAARWVYKGGEAALSEKIAGSVSEEFREDIASLEEVGKFPVSCEEQSDFFKNLKKYLETLPVIKLTIAFGPDKDFLAGLSSRLAKQIGKRIILEILVKEEAVGGLIVEYGGEYRDYSLARKLDQLMEESKLVKIRPGVKNVQAS